MGNVCTGCKDSFYKGSTIVPTSEATADCIDIPMELPLCPQCKRPFCNGCMPNHTCMMLKYKMVVLVRKDLNMTPGKVASQAAHAAVEMTRNQVDFYEERMCHEFEDWLREGGRIVILGVDNLADLLRYETEAAKHEDLYVSKYADGGITEVHPGEVTVLGIGPAKAEIIDKVTGELQPY